MEGIACNLDSPGLAAFTDAITDVKGKGEPYAITGSLPLVREMQAAGFDLQISGFGLSSVYHADNEYCLLSDMVDAFQVLTRVVSALNSSAGSNADAPAAAAIAAAPAASEAAAAPAAPAGVGESKASASPAAPAAAPDTDGMSPADVFELVVNKKSAVRWVVLELTSNSKNVQVAASGSDFTAFKAQFDAGKVLWGAFNVHGVDERNSVESVRTKVVQVNWVGSSVPPMKRMKAMQGAKYASEVIAGTVAVSVDANTAEDIDAREIAIKLANCGGAHKPTYYQFGSGIKLSLKDIGKDVAGDNF